MFQRLPQMTIIDLQAGLETAFDAVYDHYRDLLYVIIYSILKHPQASQDALQETFIKVFKEARTLTNASKFHAWIITIARNEALDALKRVKETSLDEETWNMVGSEDERSDFISLWHSCLSEIENLVIAYRIVYELTFQEIAKLTHSSIGHVHQVYRGALRTLRTVYEKDGGN